jgi:hypothetical protein
MEKENLLGKRFGKLVVIDEVHRTNGRTFWKCQCDCGNEVVVWAYSLKRGKTQSCGCKKSVKSNPIGQRYGRLTVLEWRKKYTSGGTPVTTCLCKCDCGNEKEVTYTALHNGNTRSCGCYGSEVKRTQKAHLIHGMTGSRIHTEWVAMKTRCKRSPLYKDIEVCPEWSDKENGFQNFCEWAMQNGYADDLTIDRIDSFGNYEPSNCRWATAKVQNNNRRNNVRHEYRGKSLTLGEWADVVGIKYSILYQRISRGWDIEKTLTTPVNSNTKKQKSFGAAQEYGYALAKKMKIMYEGE